MSNFRFLISRWSPASVPIRRTKSVARKDAAWDTFERYQNAS